jgi:hypothetical protein
MGVGILVLAVLDDPDDEIPGVLIMGLMRGPPLIHWLVLLPPKIRMVSPPSIVSLRERSIGLLPKVIESINLFH